MSGPATVASNFVLLQLRALGVSTIICSAVGACAWVAFRQSGIGSKPVVEVASLHETIALAQHQRVSLPQVQQPQVATALIGNCTWP